MVRPTVNDDMLEYYKKMEALLVSGLSTVRRGKIRKRNGICLRWNISITVFGYELVGREVFDKSEELLGIVTEVHINYVAGMSNLFVLNWKKLIQLNYLGLLRRILYKFRLLKLNS